MTKSEFNRLIADGETVHLECKLAKNAIPANFWETYSSFANTDGGTILLGVREENHKFSVVGVDDARKILTDFWNTVHGDKVSAVVVYEHDVRIEAVGEKQIVVIEVPRADRADRPVYVGEDVYKGTFRRNGEGDYRCSREDVTAMIRDSCAETADATVLDELQVSDLDQDSLRRYRILFDNLRPEHVWRRLEDAAFLVKIGAAKKLRDGSVHPTLAGLVCFGEFSTISDVLPNFFLDYREHYRKEIRWTDRICSGDATWSGNVIDFFFKVVQPICAGIKVPFKIASDNVTRDDDTPIHRSVREVVANALVHADYHGRQGIVIDKYPKRIEVSNPGILRISKAVAVAGGTSDARNAKIFNIFSLVKIGERSGMGLSQLYGNWEEAGYARPQLSESFNPERTKVEIEVEVAEKVAGKHGEGVKKVTEKQGEVTEKVTEKSGEVTEKVTEKSGEVTEKVVKNLDKVTEKLSETEERIMALIQSNPHITQKMLSEAIGLTRPYIGRKLLDLQSRNIIRRIGPDKGGYWEVSRMVNDVLNNGEES